jgi:hypothetical protein
MRLAGTTLVETAIAAALVAGFFGTIFEVNAVCFRYIDASKESVGALQGVQDRIETLRGLSFSNLTTASNIKTLMATPANGSDFAASKVVETVTMSDYPGATTTITYTRPAGASVTVTSSPSSVDFSSANLVKVKVTYTWNMTFGGRSMTETTETIVASGNKKA